MIDRIANAIDLAIDLLTLGQYGLERAPDVADACAAAAPPARRPPRQPLGRARRIACERPRSSTSSARCQ